MSTIAADSCATNFRYLFIALSRSHKLPVALEYTRALLECPFVRASAPLAARTTSSACLTTGNQLPQRNTQAPQHPRHPSAIPVLSFAENEITEDASNDQHFNSPKTPSTRSCSINALNTTIGSGFGL